MKLYLHTRNKDEYDFKLEKIILAPLLENINIRPMFYNSLRKVLISIELIEKKNK